MDWCKSALTHPHSGRGHTHTHTRASICVEENSPEGPSGLIWMRKENIGWMYVNTGQSQHSRRVLARVEWHFKSECLESWDFKGMPDKRGRTTVCGVIFLNIIVPSYHKGISNSSSTAHHLPWQCWSTSWNSLIAGSHIWVLFFVLPSRTSSLSWSDGPNKPQTCLCRKIHPLF